MTTRSNEQNKRFHSICSDFERSRVEWAGKPRSKEAWKAILVSGHAVASGEPGEIVEGLEGELVAVRESTARMSVKRGASLIEYAQSAAHHLGVPLHDPALEAA